MALSALLLWIPASQATPQFTLQMQDGSLELGCQAHARVGGGPDWIVRCKDQEFAVHLMVQKFPRPNGRIKYQVLYWVLDYNDRPDPTLAGTHHGTQLDFEVSTEQASSTYKLGQVVQTVWSLDVSLQL